ncbi:hypothetical protein [Aquabacterium sp.]|uniref:hypothetical protein n=1 Tax=Aquabacterium sp. TaxID=1872578 RepID=UPI003782D835
MGLTVPLAWLELKSELVQMYEVGVGVQLALSWLEAPRVMVVGNATRLHVGAEGPLDTPQVLQVHDGLTVPSLQYTRPFAAQELEMPP